jgi:hypothetical protein
VFCENRIEPFCVLSRKLQVLERSRNPPGFGPRNQLQKLACRFGVSLRRSSEHRLARKVICESPLWPYKADIRFAPARAEEKDDKPRA